MSGRRGVQYVAQCVACAALAPVFRQQTSNLSIGRCPCRQVLLPDGRIVLVPLWSDSIALFDPVSESFSEVNVIFLFR